MLSVGRNKTKIIFGVIFRYENLCLGRLPHLYRSFTLSSHKNKIWNFGTSITQKLFLYGNENSIDIPNSLFYHL